MREIIFRGKRQDNGEWVEGLLTKRPSAIQIGDMSPWFIDVPPAHPEDDGGFYNVDPATVGQYTGLKDKNGKRIFEGDICLCDRNINDTFDKTVFEIKYDTVRGFYGENFSEIDAWEFCMCEIVGNIHDNPELLGGGGDG